MRHKFSHLSALHLSPINISFHMLIMLCTGLFINMIHRLNEQVLDSSDSAKQGKTTQRRTASSNVAGTISVRSDRLSPATSTLRNLLEENAKAANSTQMDSSSLRGGCVVSEAANNGEDGDDDDSDIDVGKDQRAIKRTRIS